MATFRSNKISSPIQKINDIADQPTIGAVSEGVQFDQLNVAFTPNVRGGTSFKAVSNPGGIVGQGSSSPIPVRGFVPGTNYTFTVNGTTGGVASSASGSNTPTGAMVPIASNTVAGSTISDVTFNNIPQTYQDLMLVAFVRRTETATLSNLLITPYFTGIGASPQSTTILLGNGGSVSSLRYTSQDAQFTGSVPGGSSTSGIFGSATWHCLNYANTSTFKTTLSRSAADLNGSGETRLSASLTRATGAITVVNCSTFNGSNYFAVGSTFTLYGIKGFN